MSYTARLLSPDSSTLKLLKPSDQHLEYNQNQILDVLTPRPNIHTPKKLVGNRERLVTIHKREMLKGLLITKFRNKYATDRRPNLQTYIDNEVNKFISNERLNEDNLKKLDEKIAKEIENRDRKEAILDHHIEAINYQASPKSARLSQDKLSTTQSMPSIKRSIAQETSERVSVSSSSKHQYSDHKSRRTLSISSSQKNDLETFSHVGKSGKAEDNEWNAIVKFNTLLHYEEQKLAQQRAVERKRLMKLELDRQLADRKIRILRETEENQLYNKQQVAHLKLLEEKERQKQEAMLRKFQEQQADFDKQLKEEKEKKRKEKKDQLKEAEEHTRKLIQEQQKEYQQYQAKRLQQKEYLHKMLIENKRQKELTMQEWEKEKLEDIKAQEAYAKILEKQEEDRAREIQAREQRQQLYMNRMADTVIKDMDAKAHEEEMKIKRYEERREYQDRIDQEKRLKRFRDNSEECRKFLFLQIEERKRREQLEKEQNDEQAKIWEIDRINSIDQEKRIQEKLKKINNDTAEFLKQQMGEKQTRFLRAKMNRAEFLYNKGILRDVNAKLREHEQSQTLSQIGSAAHNSQFLMTL